MSMMKCFQCHQVITPRTPYSRIFVQELDRSFEFHNECARRVVALHVLDCQQREADIDRRFQEQKDAVRLAIRLGYAKFEGEYDGGNN